MVAIAAQHAGHEAAFTVEVSTQSSMNISMSATKELADMTYAATPQ